MIRQRLRTGEFVVSASLDDPPAVGRVTTGHVAVADGEARQGKQGQGDSISLTIRVAASEAYIVALEPGSPTSASASHALEENEEN